VAADFKTPKGRTLFGFMTVTTARGDIEIQAGSIVRRGLYQCLPTLSRAQAVAQKRHWALQAREDLVRLLRVSETDVFPLVYELRVKIRGEKNHRKGMIE
jgi:hypothetical protein